MPTIARKAVELIACPRHRVPPHQRCPHAPTGACPARVRALPRRPVGRPRTGPGWATVSVRLPLPTVEAYRLLSPEQRARVAQRMREAVEQAVEDDEA